MHSESNPYFIDQKVELGIMAEQHIGTWFKIVVMVILIIYMYGAMILKYVAGAKSFVEGVSMTIYGDQKELEERLFMDPYYIGIAIFMVLSVMFSLGNIENSKGLQVVSVFLRFFAIGLMIATSIYALIRFGSTRFEDIVWFDASNIDNLFGSTLFIFICHHSISGIISPVRPQRHVKYMFPTSFVLGGACLFIQAVLATFAFGNKSLPTDKNEFPSYIQVSF